MAEEGPGGYQISVAVSSEDLQPLSPVEAAWLGDVLGTIVKVVGPPAIKFVQDKINSMGASAADETAVAQELNQLNAQFLPALGAILPHVIGAVGGIIGGLVRPSSAGTAGTSGAGLTGTQQYGR
jgi:hypothetical protein